MAQDGVVELERGLDLSDHIERALNIQQSVVGFMNFADRVCQLAATPVFRAVNVTAGFGHHALVLLDHGRNLFALVRMDQKHDFVVSHCLPLWMKSPGLFQGLQLPDYPVQQGFPALMNGDANPTQAPALLQGSLPGNFIQADARGH